MSNKIDFPCISTLCYIINNQGQILLQKKARGFGKGKWNGPGGKVEHNETPEDSIKREVKEETGITLLKVEKVAELEFVFTENQASNNFVYVYLCRNYQGEPVDQGEGELRWFNQDELPLEKMWDDDKYWLKDVLNGKKLKMRFFFDQNDKVIKYEKV